MKKDSSIGHGDKRIVRPLAEESQEQGGSPPCLLTDESIDPDYLGLPIAPKKSPGNEKPRSKLDK